MFHRAFRLVGKRGRSLLNLTAKEHADTLAQAAANGVQGGRTYAVLLLTAVGESGAERIYTTSVRHFRGLDDDGLP
jgi:hypothetical protein